ncbi:hypothetical protein C8J56DRAFT_1037288 [Mycena floridula]|nr:hypothetical protein C8J56DRAFT_1037288 [Mycena floridula]
MSIPAALTQQTWLDMIRQGNGKAFPFLKLNVMQIVLLQSLIPSILNLQADDDKEGLTLHLKEFKLAWLAQFPEAYWTTVEQRLAEEIHMWRTMLPLSLCQDILDEDRGMLENEKQVVEFLPLGPGEHAWLTKQILFYLYGIKNWRYEETLRALYVVFLDHFPYHRHQDKAQARCQNQHITMISHRLHEKCMVTAFQKAGIYDLMQLVEPQYPGDISVDIQLHPVQLHPLSQMYLTSMKLRLSSLGSLITVEPQWNIEGLRLWNDDSVC